MNYAKQSISSKFLAATNHRGARVKVSTTSGITRVFNWKDELTQAENHLFSALNLALELGWLKESKLVQATHKDGYVHVIVEGV